MNESVRFARIVPGAIVPSRQTDGSAGYDLAW